MMQLLLLRIQQIFEIFSSIHIIYYYMILYFLFVGFMLYYCVFRSPSSHPKDINPNSIRYQIQYTIPQSVYHILQQYTISRIILHIIDYIFIQRLLLLMYCFIVFGSWSIIFIYIYPWIIKQHSNYITYVHNTTTTSSTTTIHHTHHHSIDYTQCYILSYIHLYIGIIIFVSCIYSWYKTNQSYPGIIIPSTLQYYNHYPYDYYMYIPPSSSESINTSNTSQQQQRNTNNQNNNHNNENTTTSTIAQPITTLEQQSQQPTPLSSQSNSKTSISKTLQCKVPRSKYDRMKYQYYISKYDHYCGWVHNTIGEENYSNFLLFLFVHFSMCFYGSWIVCILLYNEMIIQHLWYRTFYHRYTHSEILPSYSIIIQYMLYQYMYESIVLCIMMVMSITLGIFLIYHIYITSFYGLTSNEMYKWNIVNRYYHQELQLYNDQYKRKQMNTTTTQSQQQQQQQEEIIIEHPGPKPINIYHRGILQNWMDVIYPISIQRRKKQYELQQLQQQQSTVIKSKIQ